MDRKILDEYFSGDQLARTLGMTIEEITPGGAVVTMPLMKIHENGLGNTHGGAIFSLADFCFAVASNSHGQVAVAANVGITYLRPPAGGALTATAREIHRGRRLGTYDIDVTDGKGKTVAVFRGTVAVLEETIAEALARRK